MKKNIAYFKLPRYVLCFRKFPMTVTGKIQKYKLLDEVKQKLEIEKIWN